MKHATALSLLILCYVLVFGLYYATDSGIITAGNDMSNLIAGTFAVNDATLYTSDVFFQRFLEFYPKPFLAVHAWLTTLSGDFIITNYLISSICFIIFIIGVYWLIYSQFNHKGIALLCGLLSLAVRPALGVKYGIKIGQAIPRYFLLALSPWLILYCLQWLDTKDKHLLKWFALFFVIGLLALVHPLSARQLVLVLFGVILLRNTQLNTPFVQRVKYCFIGLFGFLLGALPFIIDKLSFVSTGGIAPRSLILSRAWFILPPYPQNFGNYGLFLLQILPFVIIGAIGYYLSDKKQKKFAHIAYAVCAVALLTGLEYFWPKAVTFEFLRASVWLYLPLLAYSCVALVKL